MKELSNAGADVTVFEPYKTDFSISDVTSANNLNNSVKNADAIILLVGHSEFKKINPEVLKEKTPARVVFDAVNCWDRAAWQSAGFSYFRLGDGKNIS